MVVSGGGSGSGDLPWQTFVGNPLEFDAPKAHTLQSVTVEFEPIQDTSGGDPSPSNICPITGCTGANVYRTGKNLIPSTLNQYSETTVYLGQSGTDYPFFLKAGTYTISSNFEGSSRVSYYYKEENGTQTTIQTNSVSGTGYSFTLPSDGNYRFHMYRSTTNGGLSVSELSNVQLEIGSSKSAYEPYQGTSVAVSWQTEAGTVYGGSLDVTSGVLTVDRTYALLNDLAKWQSTSGTLNFTYNESFSDRKLYANSYNGLLCSYYKVSSQSPNDTGRWASASNYKFGFASSTLTLTQIQQDATAGNIAILYELATPQTYQLTPQQVQAIVGRNVMWTDCVSLTVQARGTNV